MEGDGDHPVAVTTPGHHGRLHVASRSDTSSARRAAGPRMGRASHRAPSTTDPHPRTMTPLSLLDRLHERDTALYRRWRLDGDDAGAGRNVWVMLTHLGGATPTIAAALLPMLVGGQIAGIGAQAGVTLLLSTLVVQVMKRNILRTRPTATHEDALVMVPDRFSFPSGHATSIMSVAFVYACMFPSLAIPLLCLSSAVGLSRVRLGVHYPGDVLAGEAIALLAGTIVVGIW